VIVGDILLENLLSSRVRAKTLSKLLLSPGESFNAWELSQLLTENYSVVWKELNRLEKLGILTSEQVGRAKVYTANPACPFITELRSIVVKTEGIGVILDKVLSDKDVKEAFIFGSYASGDADKSSDLDLLIIGNISLVELSDTISTLEEDLNRPVNYVNYTEAEWKEKLAARDAFAVNVMNSPRIMLIRGENVV
jgi:predicted nucleotidyltransferase